ncbi:MAG TPA: DMT family transporter [Pseudolabrys sp.]|jgi:drug/metabolite transporter (DMT)-like permease
MMTSDSLDQRRPVRTDRVPLGILYMLGATVMFAVASALSKWQVASYSFIEVLSFRASVSLLVCAVLILPRTGLIVFRTSRLRHHAGRSATQATAQSLIIIAFSLMPLAGAIAINFASPLFATLFAALWLKEKVGAARGFALAAGFIGVLLVAAPGADTFRIGALFAIGNAVLFGSVTAAVRGMTATESTETLTMYQMVFLTGFFALALPFVFTWPTAEDAAVMIANGVINGFGQYWWTRSLSLAPPSAVGPFYYFMLVWSIALGFLFWGDVPTLPLLAGAAIVAGSGLFLLWHESGKKPLSAD